MAEAPPRPNPEELLAESGRVRALARRLVFDAGRTDDVVQEAWLSAIQGPPRGEVAPGWWARVVENAARQLARSEGRRARRERRASRDEAVPAAAELVEQAELQRELVSAVLALDEPYLSTILLRYFRGLSPKAMAEAGGLSQGTVRSRLKRGLALLKEELDRRLGDDRRSWSMALIPLAATPSRAGTTAAGGSLALTAGVLAMGLKLKLTLVAGALVLGLGLLEWNRDRTGVATPPEDRGTDPVAEPLVTPAGIVAPQPDSPAGARTEVEPVAAGDDAAGPAAPDSLPPVTGVVTDPEGVPVPGATLRLFPKRGQWSELTPLSQAATDAQGRYELTLGPLPEGVLILEARAQGFITQSKDPIEPGLELTFQLMRAVEVFGRVVDADTGRGIQGARLYHGFSGEEATCAADGSYRIGGVPVGLQVELNIRAPGYAIDRTRVLLSEPKDTQLDIELQRGVALALEVFDLDSGEPIRGAVMTGYDGRIEASSDAQGRLRIAVVEGRELSVRISAPEYGELRWTWKVGDPDPEQPPRVPLRRTAWIEGVVVDEQGRGLEGVSLYIDDPGHPFGQRLSEEQLLTYRLMGYVRYQQDGRYGTSDGEGRFRLAFLPTETARVHASLEGFADTRSEDLRLEPGAVVACTLTLGPAATLRGRVLVNGKPKANMDVLLRDAEDGIAGRANTDDEGRYAFADLAGGRVTVYTREGEKHPGGRAELDLVAGEDHQQDLSWEVNLATIQGTVRGAEGQPLEGLSVWVWSQSPAGDHVSERAETEADGTYRVEIPDQLEYQVVAYRGKQRVERRGIPAGATGVDFAFERLGLLRLELVDAATQKPVLVRGHQLWNLAWRAAGTEAFQNRRDEIDTQGRVTMKLPVGAVDLSLYFGESGYARREVHNLAVTDQPDPAPVRIELERGVALTLRIEGETPFDAGHRAGHLLFVLEEGQVDTLRGPFPTQGGPSNHRINGVNMWVRDPGMLHRLLNFDASGSARLEGLAPGRYTLRAFPDDYAFEPEWFEVVAGAADPIELRWQPR